MRRRELFLLIRNEIGNELGKIEFYIDNDLKATVNAEPYSWDWTARTFGKHTIKDVAYGFHNDTASKEIEVTKIL